LETEAVVRRTEAELLVATRGADHVSEPALVTDKARKSVVLVLIPTCG
jgi:hypothetical protein